jgi:hypothetical protein
VPNGTYIPRSAVQSSCVGILNPTFDSGERTMFGYGLIGTLVVIVLVIWIVKRV